MTVWDEDDPLQTPFKKSVIQGCEEYTLRVLKICLSFQVKGMLFSEWPPMTEHSGTSLATSIWCSLLWQAIFAPWFPFGLAETLSDWHQSLTSLPFFLSYIHLSFHRCYSQWIFYTPNFISLPASWEPKLQGTGVRGKVVSCSITESGDPTSGNNWRG